MSIRKHWKHLKKYEEMDIEAESEKRSKELEKGDIPRHTPKCLLDSLASCADPFSAVMRSGLPVYGDSLWTVKATIEVNVVCRCECMHSIK